LYVTVNGTEMKNKEKANAQEIPGNIVKIDLRSKTELSGNIMKSPVYSTSKNIESP
jgi:hypothetical protein